MIKQPDTNKLNQYIHSSSIKSKNSGATSNTITTAGSNTTENTMASNSNGSMNQNNNYNPSSISNCTTNEKQISENPNIQFQGSQFIMNIGSNNHQNSTFQNKTNNERFEIKKLDGGDEIPNSQFSKQSSTFDLNVQKGKNPIIIQGNKNGISI